MLSYDKDNNVFRATHLSDLFQTELTSGSVFSVYARPMSMPGGRCLTIRVRMTADEGAGRCFEILLANNQEDNIPTQVELMLMDLDCAATWMWDISFSQEAYQCQFARSRNPKTVGDSGAYRFEKVL